MGVICSFVGNKLLESLYMVMIEFNIESGSWGMVFFINFVF